MATQDSQDDVWKSAERPNYQRNVDLQYPYSELPFLGRFRLKKLPFNSKVLEHVDYWGQGRIIKDNNTSGFPDVYNINYQFQRVTKGPDLNAKIPNRIPVLNDEDCDTSAYISDNSVRTVTVKTLEINKSCAIDIARMVNNNIGKIVLYGIEPNSESFLNVKELVKQKNIFFCPHYERTPELQTVTGSYVAFLNYFDMKKIIYQKITHEKYDEAVEQTKWLDDTVLKDFADGLLVNKILNTMSFTYQLWESDGKDMIQFHFPKSFYLILAKKSVIIWNREYFQTITLEEQAVQNRRLAWGKFGWTDNSKWNTEPAWENNAVYFKFSNPSSNWYLGVDEKVDSYGDRLVYATSGHNEDRYKFYLEPRLNDNGEDAVFFIINYKYNQGLKLDVNTNKQGERRVWGNRGDVYQIEVLENSNRFRWSFNDIP